MKYENYINLFKYERLKTGLVKIGNIKIGEGNPICIQSMVNTNTLNTDETVEQSLRIIKEGGEFVRITAQGANESENLKNIKKEIRVKGIDTPIVADVHFNPKAAFVAAKIVEKVRINPGNFVDKQKVFSETNITDEEFKAGLIKIEEKFIPLITICKEHNTSLRIGVNHGSLSGRIMHKYGDTSYGMVESAMEFLRICVREDFLNIVVSLKSSNTRVMVQANRLIVAKMIEEGMSFPLHLGVTEAGEGEDGRIKSAVGIGTLLADGIGDTIRVSLTEPPENEIPVAQKLVHYISERIDHKPIKEVEPIPINFYDYRKRKSNAVLSIGNTNHPIVISSYDKEGDSWPDFIYLGDKIIVEKLNDKLNYIVDEVIWEQQIFESEKVYPLFSSINNYYFCDKKSSKLNFIKINTRELDEESLKKIKNAKDLVLVLETSNKNGFADQRVVFLKLINFNCLNPVIIKRNYKEDDLENLQLKSASDIGGLFIDGLGDGIWVDNKGAIDNQDIINTSFGILQASRVRMSKTEYISCPGCGRTLFDLQKTISEIRKRTSHLKNLKIGIMGCIVNGPGEMADADYGYVGAGSGKITLYKNKEVVEKNISEKNAVEKLIQLIKDNGDWID